MSSGAATDQPSGEAPVEWNRLELTVRRLLEGYEGWRRRARTAEVRVQELERALRDVSGGELDPLALAARLQAAERENGALRRRLDQARDRVRRILSRLEFLEEERERAAP